MSLAVDIIKKLPDFTLDVAFEAGNETLGFLGASGCGKSLTLRCIAGIDTPDEGKIIVNGTTFFDKAAGKKPHINLTAQERKTALLFQNYQLFPNLDVYANVAAGLSPRIPQTELDHAVRVQLQRFGLIGLEQRYPAQLSGGQQQRVALARMLAAQPGILMLDEPFSALDAHLKSELEQNLISLFQQYEGTILYISHDIDEAYRFCDRIAVVNDGHIDELAPKHDVITNPQSLAAIRLSGCKNTTPALYIDDHHVRLPQWGITFYSQNIVDPHVAWLGIRAYYIKRLFPDDKQPDHNVFRMRCDRVSDSRFERAVMVAFLDAHHDDGSAWDDYVNDESMRFFKTHVRWNVDKHMVSDDLLPQEGDELTLHFPPDALYLVTH